MKILNVSQSRLYRLKNTFWNLDYGNLAGCGLDGTPPCKVRKFGCKQVLVKPHGSTRFCVLSMAFLVHSQSGTSSEPVTSQLVEAAYPSRRQDEAGVG